MPNSRLLLLALALAVAHSYPNQPMDGNLTSPDPTDAQHSSHGRALQTRHTIVADSPTSVVEQWETQLFTLSLGLLLLVLAPVLLVGAEVAAARFAKLLKQARSLTCADAPSDRPRKRFNAHVVHTQGVMTVGPSWSDADTGVSWGASLADKLDTCSVGLLEQAGAAPPGQPTPFYPPRFTPSAAPRRPSIDRRLSEPGASSDAASADAAFNPETRFDAARAGGQQPAIPPLGLSVPNLIQRVSSGLGGLLGGLGGLLVSPQKAAAAAAAAAVTAGEAEAHMSTEQAAVRIQARLRPHPHTRPHPHPHPHPHPIPRRVSVPTRRGAT